MQRASENVLALRVGGVYSDRTAITSCREYPERLALVVEPQTEGERRHLTDAFAGAERREVILERDATGLAFAIFLGPIQTVNTP